MIGADPRQFMPEEPHQMAFRVSRGYPVTALNEQKDSPMILEVATLDVIPGKEAEFEAAFREASGIIAGMQGYLSHSLERCVEKRNRYMLLVHWQTLEDHTIGFRQSADYQRWKALLHHFYDPFPAVEHFERVM